MNRQSVPLSRFLAMAAVALLSACGTVDNTEVNFDRETDAALLEHFREHYGEFHGLDVTIVPCARASLFAARYRHLIQWGSTCKDLYYDPFDEAMREPYQSCVNKRQAMEDLQSDHPQGALHPAGLEAARLPDALFDRLDEEAQTLEASLQGLATEILSAVADAAPGRRLEMLVDSESAPLYRSAAGRLLDALGKQDRQDSEPLKLGITLWNLGPRLGIEAQLLPGNPHASNCRGRGLPDKRFHATALPPAEWLETLRGIPIGMIEENP